MSDGPLSKELEEALLTAGGWLQAIVDANNDPAPEKVIEQTPGTFALDVSVPHSFSSREEFEAAAKGIGQWLENYVEAINKAWAEAKAKQRQSLGVIAGGKSDIDA